MPQITLKPVISGFNLSTINTNFGVLQLAINLATIHSFDGNNIMIQPLDMSGNRIFNLPDAVSGTEPLTLNQASALTATEGFVSTIVEKQIASVGQVLFTLTSALYTPGVDNLSCYRNGAYLDPSQYTQTATNKVTFINPATLDDEYVFVVNQRNVDSTTTPAFSVTYTPTGEAQSNVQTQLAIVQGLVRSGTGTPEAAVTAPVGTLFLRSDGGASTTLYVKETGTGNTGWVAK